MKREENILIKILSIVGGFLVMLAILGLLTLAGLAKSKTEMFVFGIGFVVGAIGCNKGLNNLLSDALSIPAFAGGLLLIGISGVEFDWHGNGICLIFIIIALCSLCIVQSYIFSFVSVLVLTGSVLSLILINEAYDWIFIYNSVAAGAVTCLFRTENQWLTKDSKFSRLYNPLRSGLVLSFLVGLFLTGKEGIIPLEPVWIWLSAVVPAVVILCFTSNLLRLFRVKSVWNKSVVYFITVLLLGVTAFSPALSGTFLIILLSFHANYKSGLGLGIISFIYFIIQYYYDLHFSLLVKSGLLFSSGILFIVCYLLFTHKKAKVNEKI
ncbi:permease [Bacteroidia bacterium]|nr:permease [Bacteroidia bacterium]